MKREETRVSQSTLFHWIPVRRGKKKEVLLSGVAVAHCGDKDTGGSREYSLVWALLKVAILIPRPGPTQQPIGFSAGMSQAKQPTGWECSPSHQQTGCLSLPEPTATSKHTPWNGHAHQRDKTQLHPPVGKHQSLPPESLHKPLRPASPTSGQTLKARGTTILQPAEQRQQTQKVRQNETAEEYVPDEGTR